MYSTNIITPILTKGERNLLGKKIHFLQISLRKSIFLLWILFSFSVQAKRIESPQVCYTITNPSSSQTLCEGVIGASITVNTTATAAYSIRFVQFTTDKMAGAAPTTAEANFLYSYTGAFKDLDYTTPASGVATYNFEPREFPNTGNSNITYYVYAVLNEGVLPGSTCRAVVEIPITIKPKPTVNFIQDQYVCAGTTTSAISLTGSNVTGTTYPWTNTLTSIGLSASGTGNIAAFTAVNGGASPVTAKITVTPTASGCTGMARSFNIMAYPVSASMISGVAFKDFNENGVRESSEGLQSGITVNVYNSTNTLVNTTTTDVNGYWSVSGLTFGGANKYRVEFVIPTALANTGLQPSANGTDNKTNVQFVSAASCNIDFGVNYPSSYSQSAPLLVTAIHTNGSRALNGSETAVIVYNNTDRGQGLTFQSIATVGEVGSIWGEAYNPKNKKLYVSAFVKRHVDLGPNGLGAIYEIDVANPTTAGAGTPTLWLDINSPSFVNQSNVPVNLNFPADPGAASRGLGAKGSPNRDNWAFDYVGRQGIGSIELSADAQRLYVMDMTNRQVLCIDYNTKKLMWKLAVSTPACPGGSGDVRPWGLKEHNGVLYVGVLCSGETNQNNAQMHYYVMQCNSLTAATSMSVAVDMGTSVDKQDSDWQAWAPANPVAYLSTLTDGTYVVYPQPVIANIDFDKDDNMIIGVMDRTGHQFGNANYIPLVSNTYLVKCIGNGVLTRATRSGSTYTIEPSPWSFFDTKAGLIVSNSPNDQFNGGLSVSSATGENIALAQTIDPLDYESTGAIWLKTSDGKQLGGTNLLGRVELVPKASSAATFGKANGLGDLESLVEPAAIEVGNYIWNDLNQNGIQDANEDGIWGVNVSLYKGSSLIGITTTDANGQYYFNASNVDTTGVDVYGVPVTGFTGLSYNSNYYIVVGGSVQFYGNLLNVSGVTYQLSNANIGTGANADNNDSDGTIASGINTTINGFPYISITTAGAGGVNHTYDMGFYEVGSVGNFVWYDENKDGLQNTGELGINGLTVELWNNTSATLVGSTTTANDASGKAGYYNFIITANGNYYVKFPTTTNNKILTTQTLTAATDGNSDANVTTGKSPVFTINVQGTGTAKDNLTIDAGFKCNLTASLAKSNDLSCPSPTAILTASPSTGVSYLWDNGSTSATRSVSAAGTYSVIVRDMISGCSVSANVTVTSVVSVPPCISISSQKTK